MKDLRDHLIAIAMRGEAADALKNGTRVKKVWNEEGDTHELGALATIIGSLAIPKGEPNIGGQIMYCVEWDDAPGVPVFVIAKKLDVV